MRSADFLWNAAPSDLQLADGQVHVLAAPLDASANRLAELAQWLAPDEWQRAKRFHLERDSRRFIIGRGTLREILGGLLDVKPLSVVFSYGQFGKPSLATPGAAHSLRFNLAHSDSIAVYAFAKHELGVDIERIRALAEAEQIAARFFSPREAGRWRALPARLRSEAFFNCWTRKEAYLKAVGSGLDDRLSQIEVSFASGATAELPGIFHDSPSWFLHPLTPVAAYVGALAIKQDGLQVNCWRWPGLP